MLTYLKRSSKLGKKPKQKELTLGFEDKETAQEWASLLQRNGDQQRATSSVEKPLAVDSGGRLGDHLVSGSGIHPSEASRSLQQPDSPEVRSLLVRSLLAFTTYLVCVSSSGDIGHVQSTVGAFRMCARNPHNGQIFDAFAALPEMKLATGCGARTTQTRWFSADEGNTESRPMCDYMMCDDVRCPMCDYIPMCYYMPGECAHLTGA